MLLDFLKKIYYSIFCRDYEVKIIERISSSGTIITYASDNEE